jgi:hypothetical protein
MMTAEEIDKVAEAVTSRMLEAPSGVEVRLIFPGGKSPFVTGLPGVPRVGDVVWHPPRRNSKPQRFVVRLVEWWSTWPNLHVRVHLNAAPGEPGINA